MNQQSRRGALALGFAVAMVASSVGVGQTSTWVGGGPLDPSGNWSATSNWNPVGTPGNGDDASIDMTASGGIVTYDYTGTAVTLDSLYINASTRMSVIHDLAELAISANDLTADSETVDVSGSGQGFINQSGGVNTVTSDDASLVVNGIYDLSGGTNAVGGSSGNETVNGTYSLSGGTNSVTGQYASLVVIGTYNMSGGNNPVSGDDATLLVDGGNFNLSGGTSVVSAPDTALIDGLVVEGNYSISNTGSLSATREQAYFDQSNNYIGTIVQTGGYNSSTKLSVTSYYEQSGGTNETSTLAVSGGFYDSEGDYLGDATYAMSGGSLYVSTAEDDYTTFIQSGGDHTVASNSTGKFEVYGQYLLSGGNLTVNTLEQVNGFSQSGGANAANGGIEVTGYYGLSAGTLMSNGTAIDPNAKMQVSGGIWTDPYGITVSGSGVLALQSGMVSTPTLALSGGAGGLQWTGGTLAMTGAGGMTIGRGAFGDLTVSTSMLLNVTNTLTIQPGYYLSLAGGGQMTIGGLSLGPTAVVDVTNSHFFVDYGSGADPIGTIRSYLMSGYAGGAWSGAGIISSAAASNPGYGLGYADSADPGNPAGLSSGTIEVKYTLYGDANLDGTVNSVDFGILAANFGKSGKSWDEGDFNYDGTVNSVDFGELATNFGKSATGTAVQISSADWAALDAFAAANGLMTDVPEPANMAVIAGIFGTLMIRRRKPPLCK